MRKRFTLPITAGVLLATAGSMQFAFGQQDDGTEPRYTYHENDGIYLFYETDQEQAYRSLLPPEFDMPERLLVQAFIADFYEMDDRTQPYKEGAIFLLANYEGRKAWHCITMPVTSQESRIMGILRLGLPKIMGEIRLARQEPYYAGTVSVEGDRGMALALDTDGYTIGDAQKDLLRELTVLPKLNLRRGEVVEMSRAGSSSIIDLAEMFPNRITVTFGKGKVTFDPDATPPGGPWDPGSQVHAFGDLPPTQVLGAFYMKNTFTYRLGLM